MADHNTDIKKTTVVIAGRSYPVKVSDAEARVLPNIEKMLNDQIRKMQLTFKDRDIQDCLSMVLLTNALSSTNATPAEQVSTAERLDALNSLVDSAINS